MDNNGQQKNAQPVIELWEAQMHFITRGKSSLIETHEINLHYLPLWLDDIWLRLRFARKIEVEQLRRFFILRTLTEMDYDVRQAKRAQLWLLHGDWRFKGADPSVELSDFTPTEDQYHQTFVKIWAKVQLPKPERFEDSQHIPNPIDPEALEQIKAQLNRVFQRYGIAPIGGTND